MERNNYYADKTCERCGGTYFGYKASKRCKPCRRKAKTEWERERLQDPEYKERRKATSKIWEQANKEKRANYQRDWASANPEKIKAYALKYYYANPTKSATKREKQKLRQWGLTIEQYEELLKRQNGVCAICNKACSSGRKLAIDHDHKTGRIRGLLCSNCNLGLGKFFDNKELLRKAISYL